MGSFHYIQVDPTTGKIVSDSWLSGEVKGDHMIRVADDFSPWGLKYDFTSKTWVKDEDSTENQ